MMNNPHRALRPLPPEGARQPLGRPGGADTNRRNLLLALVATPLTLAATGCGFKLREAPNFAFSTISVRLPESSQIGNELRRNIAASGKVQVITDPAQFDKAEVILEAIQDQREKIVVGLTSSGQVREFQLRLRFRFRLRTPLGKELITDAEILQQRDISFNESAVLAKDAEEQLLYRNMQSDIVQQIMRRLAAVQSL
jgi:LPS-assembly lipoprotein